jgi:cytoskeletal protein CcmA (bactofilin family)
VKGKAYRKLKSGALQFAVFIAVLIALLLSGLLLYAYTFIYLKEQSKSAIESIQLLDSGMTALLEPTNTYNDTLTLDCIESENHIIKMHLSQWGIFEKAFVTSQHRRKKFTKVAILGSESIANESPTLFLQESYNPLTLVGLTKIKGIAHLPSQGVKPGYIAGQSYFGTQLIDGEIKRSGEKLPKLNKNTLDELQFYSKRYKPLSELDFISLEGNTKIVNSFTEKTKGYFSVNPIVLENVNVTGNIIIKSDVLIRIKKTALLKDLILIAPSVEIEEGVSGSFQVIATKKITVAKNCKLNYPSALLLSQDGNSIASDNILENQIFIDEGTVIYGTVCYLQTKEGTDFKIHIGLEKSARIKGQVYCNGNFELKGTVSGTVCTKQFVANQAGSVYVNHIYEGVIENEHIPDVFGGILFENQRKTIMKWLY